MAINQLIQTSKLKELSFIQENVDVGKLTVIIQRVQDMYIEDILGSALYQKLLSDNPTFSGNYATLMSDYVIPCLTAYCDYESVVFLRIKLTAKTVGTSSDERIDTVDQEQATYARDRLYKHAIKYRNRLVDYIKDNLTLFPEYEDLDSNVKPSGTGTSMNVMFVGEGTRRRKKECPDRWNDR